MNLFYYEVDKKLLSTIKTFKDENKKIPMPDEIMRMEIEAIKWVANDFFTEIDRKFSTLRKCDHPDCQESMNFQCQKCSLCFCDAHKEHIYCETVKSRIL